MIPDDRDAPSEQNELADGSASARSGKCLAPDIRAGRSADRESMKRTMHLGIVATLISLLVGGCAESRGAAEAGTREFRVRCARAEFSRIYKEAAPEFRNKVAEADFTKLLEAVREKLGTWQSSKPPAWTAFSGTGGRRMTLKYDSQVEKGAAVEEFVWRIQDGRGILLGYQINSPVFLAN
jgi:hypothetical protein